jgi:hypothetical protein
MTKRFALVLASVSVVAVGLTVGGAGAAEPPQNANEEFVTGSWKSSDVQGGGHGTISAHLGPKGDAFGQATARVGKDRIVASVTCLSFDSSNNAIVGLEVRRSTNPALGEPGDQTELRFIDNGPPVGGMPTDQVFSREASGCTGGGPEVPFVLDSGNIVVSDGA